MFRFFENFRLQFLVALVVFGDLAREDLDALHDHTGISGLTVSLDIFNPLIKDFLPLVGGVLALILDLISLQLALLDLEVEIFDLVLVVYCLVVLVHLLGHHEFDVKPLHQMLLFA